MESGPTTSAEEPARNVQIARLRRFPMFEGMETPTLERISAGSAELDLPAGSVLYRRGERSNGLFLVIEGMLKLCLQAPQGAERVVQMVGPGDCFGESALVGESVHMLTAEVIAPAQLVHMGRTIVREELNRTPVFARSIISSLSLRLSHVIRAFEDCTLRSGAERVAGYLVERLPAGARAGRVQVTLDTKKGIIAAQLNLTQEHFSRILRELSTSGILEVHGQLLDIVDVARLIRLGSSDIARANGDDRKRLSDSPRPVMDQSAAVRPRRGR